MPILADIDQLTRIMSVVGTPNEEFLKKIQSEEARNYIRNLPPMPRRNFRELFANASDDAVSLLEQTLNLDPDYRCTMPFDITRIQADRCPGDGASVSVAISRCRG
jgi:serine/threonine protein kinase